MEELTKFTDLIEENLNVPNKGEVFKGRVVRVDEDDVFIDFGFKSEGIASKDEFYGKNGDIDINIGDEVEVILEAWHDNFGLPKLSKKRADLIKEKQRIENSYKKGNLINGRIKEKVKGGLILDIGHGIEIKGFLPASQIDLRPQGDLDKFIGRDFEVKIIKLSDDGIVLSRRAYLEEQREIQRNKTLSTLNEGNVIGGKVVKIIDQGAIIDLGGIEGFLPISELSWGRVRHPSDILSLDDEIRVKVLKVEEDYRISLGLKQTKPDPWTLVNGKYNPGKKIRGKVVSVVDFGIFIEIEPGIEGLVHVSEIAWIKRFRHPKEIINLGRRVEAMIIDVDVDRRRIALSLRRIEPSPWELLKEKNPKGSRIKGIIKNVTDKGIFVDLGEDLVGLVRPNEISWNRKSTTKELYQVGDEIEVMILNVDEKNQRIGLGIKQLREDPWELALQQYKPGETVLTVGVIDIKERGIVVELENDVEGYIRNSEFNQIENKDLNNTAKIGDQITAQVTGFERSKKQVILSVKRYEEWLENQRMSSFLSSQGNPNVTLGDLLRDKLKST